MMKKNFFFSFLFLCFLNIDTQSSSKINSNDNIDWYIKNQKENIDNSDFYFNLANMFAKNKNYINAIVYYEKSLKYDLSNEYAKFNLNICRAKLNLEPLVYDNFLENLYKIIFFIEEYKLKILIIVFVWIFAFLYYLSINNSNLILKNIKYASFLFLCIVMILLFFQNIMFESNSSIIIRDTEGFKNFNSKEGSKTIFKGSKIELLDNIEDNFLVSFNNNKYWIPKNSFIKI